MIFPTNDEDRFYFLKNYLPPQCDIKLKRINNEVERKRFEILEVERFISLSLLTKTKKYPAKYMPPIKEFINMLENQTFLTPKDVHPSFVQQSSLLVNFAYSNPKQLAIGVAKMKFSEEFPFIVSSTLPSLFGYFVSEEYMRYAERFYTTFVETQTQKVSLVVIQPFFCSVLTYRYVESVMEGFLIKIGAETHLNDGSMQNDLIEKFSAMLTSLIIKFMCLLPSAFFNIFKVVLNNKWKRENLVQLFFSNFARPQFLSYVEASPFSSSRSFVSQVLNNIANDDKFFTQILNSWFITLPNLDILSIYTPFNHMYLTLLLTVSDVEMAAQCCKIGGLLPNTLNDIDYSLYKTHKVKFSPINIRVYPRDLKTPSAQIDHILIPQYDVKPSDAQLDVSYRAMKAVTPHGSTVYEQLCKRKSKDKIFLDYSLQKSLNEMQEQTNSLEKYLVVMFNEKLLDNLSEIVRSREFFIKLPFALHQILDKKNTHIKYSHFVKKFPSINVKKTLYLYFLYNRIQICFDRFQKEFDQLKGYWEQLSKNRRVSCDLTVVNNLRDAPRNIYLEAADTIQSLGSAYISRQFELMIKALKMIQIIDKSQFLDILRTLLIITNSSYVPLVYIVFNEYVIKSKVYREMMPEKEYKLWIKFERFLLVYMDDNEIKEARGLFVNLCSKVANFKQEQTQSSSKSKSKSKKGKSKK